ncbi:hypothetical protein PIB30_088168, partial [Stylosanthes scabra]|nr:hypothetical protein [Stylosanthes scabra]
GQSGNVTKWYLLALDVVMTLQPAIEFRRLQLTRQRWRSVQQLREKGDDWRSGSDSRLRESEVVPVSEGREKTKEREGRRVRVAVRERERERERRWRRVTVTVIDGDSSDQETEKL